MEPSTGPVKEASLLPFRSFTAGGESYLYATESGGLFRMDDGVRDALSAYAASGAASIPPEILSDFRRAGLLQAVGGAGAVARTALPPFRPRTMVLMLTYACNLACRYCYEDREGCALSSAPAADPGEMSPEALRRCVAYLLDHAEAARKVSVTFFGGEPLLRFPLIQTAVGEARRMASARGKEISFSITTNGTLLTGEIAEFLRENGVSVCISIDGPREIHDRNRPYASGRGSYEDVERGLSFFKKRKHGFPLAARVTLGHGDVDVGKTFGHLRGLGFDEVGFAPASAAEGSPVALTGDDLRTVMEGFRDLADVYVDDVRRRRMPAFSNMSQILALIHRGDPMPYPCGAGIGMLAVDPAGTFYPCHRLCGIGDSFGDTESGISEGVRARFLEGARRRRRTACDACWAKNFCSGGCYHDAYLRQGDLFAPSVHYCRWIQELFHLGLQTYVRIQNETPTFLEAMLGERGIA
ncbi:MAG TPA: radical SAM protein [Candidatus Deferrimicrobiaceae bacterium]|nr:radical SAM protein [Candidatus Deferrimicrobiaceae bacterium]